MESKSINNLIDREALKRDVRDVVFQVADTPLSNDAMSKLVFQMGELLAKKIDDAPGVEAEPVRHGRWIHRMHRIFGNTYDYECSVCGCDYALAEYNYCPNCGAKMDAEVEG